MGRVKHEAMTGNVNRDGRPGFLLHLTKRNTQHRSSSFIIFMIFMAKGQHMTVWQQSVQSNSGSHPAHALQPLGSEDFTSDCFPSFSPSLSAQGQVTPRKNMGHERD